MCFGNVLPFHPNNDMDLTINSDSVKVQKDNPKSKLFEKSEFKDISPNLECKYYSLDDLKGLDNNNRNLSIYHNNFNGLENKHDHLLEFLEYVDNKFDLVTITETSEKYNHGGFLSNVELHGFNLFSTPTTSNKGGTAIYVRNTFDSLERTDLKIMNNNFETTWIEIKNKKSKKNICGTFYRHPREDLKSFQSFINYLESILFTITKENKEIYITGDFNIDLLKH